jgi:hypothetical protein
VPRATRNRGADLLRPIRNRAVLISARAEADQLPLCSVSASAFSVTTLSRAGWPRETACQVMGARRQAEEHCPSQKAPLIVIRRVGGLGYRATVEVIAPRLEAAHLARGRDHCDWRLQTIVELSRIVDLGASGCGSGTPASTRPPSGRQPPTSAIGRPPPPRRKPSLRVARVVLQCQPDRRIERNDAGPGTSRGTVRQASAKDMKRAYQLVTEQILAALEGGVVPWRQPWDGADDANAESRHRASLPRGERFAAPGRADAPGLRIAVVGHLRSGARTARPRAEGRARHRRPARAASM